MWNKEFLESGRFAKEVEQGNILALRRSTSREVRKFFDVWGGNTAQERLTELIGDVFDSYIGEEGGDENEKIYSIDDIEKIRDKVEFWICLKDLLAVLAPDDLEYSLLLRRKKEEEPLPITK